MSEEQVPPPPSESPPPPSAPPPPAAPPPPPAAATGGPSGDESPNRQLWIVLSYLWIFALIPFLIEKKDREALWHAKHGLVLTAAEILLWILMNIANWILGAIFGPLACFGCALFAVIFGAVTVFRIFCIVKGLGGERLTIPGVSEFADRF